MHVRTAGWYEYYLFKLPGQHELLKDQLIEFWTSDILRRVAIGLCFCLIPILGVFPRLSKPATMLHDVFLLGSLFLASYLVRMHFGGYDNVLIPAYAGVAIYFGMGWGWPCRSSARVRGPGWR